MSSPLEAPLEAPQPIPEGPAGDAISDAAAEAWSPNTVRSESVAPLTVDQFADLAQQLFPQLDIDEDGILEGDELAVAVADSKYVDQEAQVVAALLHSREGLQMAADDFYWDETGITVADLSTVGETYKRWIDQRHAMVLGRLWLEGSDYKNFALTDINSDGFLSYKELDMALQNSELEANARIGLTYLRDNIQSVQDGHDDGIYVNDIGIAKADLPGHDHYVTVESPEAAMMRFDFIINRTAESQQAGMDTGLYSDPTNPLSSICPDAIRQGTAGNCYFLAALASLAVSDKQSIVDMISANDDGTFTVTFPGDPDHPITISAPTEAEMGLYNGASQHGIWACVIEKAFGQYRQANPTIWDFGKEAATPQDYSTAGKLSDALELLTGRDFERHSVDGTFGIGRMSDEKLYQFLDESLNGENPQPIGASISYALLPSLFINGSPDGFPATHAYSIIGFQPDGNGGGTVTVRNPWGDGVDTPRGVMQLSLEEFQRNFTHIYVPA
jgi:hypothetical protein